MLRAKGAKWLSVGGGSFSGIKIFGYFLAFFLISAVHCNNAISETYFVAPNGSDSGSGTISDPWATPQRAATVAIGGDVIYLRGGTYRVTAKTSSFVNFAYSGTPTSPITMSSYPGEMAILNGMLNRSNPSYWTLDRGKVYYARDLSGSEFDGTVPVVVQDEVVLTPQPSLAKVKGPGQTYYDKNKRRLYVWAIGNGNPGNYTLEISQCDQVFYFDAADQYILLENLTITGAFYGVRCEPNGCCRTLRNLTLKHFKEDGIKFNTTGNRDDLVEYCKFSSYGDCGIDTYGSSNQTFRYNEFTKAHPWDVGGGIKSLADGKNHIIDGNYFHDITASGWEGVIELREAEDILVTNNLIVNTAGGINVYGDNDTLSTPVPDPTSVGVEIVNNTISRTTSSAIWISKTCRDTVVQNNIVVQGSANSYCLRVDSGGEVGCVSDYNDFVRSGGGPIRWLGADYSLSSYQAATLKDSHSISQDPLFVNPYESDFHLGVGSPAIDRGDLDKAPSLDMEKVIRPQGEGVDLGAYER
jgi:hypothetical protein